MKRRRRLTLSLTLLVLGLLVTGSGLIWIGSSRTTARSPASGQATATPSTAAQPDRGDAGRPTAHGPLGTPPSGPAAEPVVVATVTVTVTQSAAAADRPPSGSLAAEGPLGTSGNPSAASPMVIVVNQGQAGAGQPLVLQLITTLSGAAVAVIGAYASLVWVRRGKPDDDLPPAEATGG